MASHTRGIFATVGMVFVILSLSILIPAIFVSIQDTQKQTVSQTVNTPLSVTNQLEATIINASENSPNPDSAEISLLNRATGEYEEFSLQQNQTVTTNFSAGEVNATLISVDTSKNIVMEYQYPMFISWPPGTPLIIDNLPLVILLTAIVFLTGVLFILMDLEVV